MKTLRLTSSDRAILLNARFFSRLPRSAIEAIVEGATVSTHEAHVTLFRQNEPLDDVLVVLSGLVRLYRLGKVRARSRCRSLPERRIDRRQRHVPGSPRDRQCPGRRTLDHRPAGRRQAAPAGRRRPGRCPGASRNSLSPRQAGRGLPCRRPASHRTSASRELHSEPLPEQFRELLLPPAVSEVRARWQTRPRPRGAVARLLHASSIGSW